MSVTGRDFDRPLTREGRLQARYLARVLSQAPPSERPRKIVASPAVRTMQTAQAIADELGLSITAVDDLLPACPAGQALSVLDRQGHDAPMLLVGHNPTVSSIVSILLHGPSAGLCICGPALRTGQMATIEIDKACPPGEGKLIDLYRYEPVLVG